MTFKKDSTKEPIIKIYDFSDDEYKVSISNKIGRKKGFEIMKGIVEAANDF